MQSNQVTSRNTQQQTDFDLRFSLDQLSFASETDFDTTYTQEVPSKENWELEVDGILDDPEATAPRPAPVRRANPAPTVEDYDYPVFDEPTAGERFSEFLSDHRTSILVTVCTIVLLAIFGVCGYVIMQNQASSKSKTAQTIPQNVSIGGYDIGGMTRENAINTLTLSLGTAFENTDMVVVLDQQQIVLSPDKTGAMLNIAAAVNACMQVNDDNSASKEIDLLTYLSLNRNYIQANLNDYVNQLASESDSSSYMLRGAAPALDDVNFDPEAPCQTLVLTIGKDSTGINTEKLLEQVLNTYGQAKFRAEIDMESIQYEREPLDLEEIYTEVSSAPRTGMHGYDFDLENAKTLLRNATPGTKIEIPMRYDGENSLSSDPDYPDILASYQTPHGTNENRNANLKLVCEALDGYVLQPGQTFSYNHIVGEPTVANGYKSAPEYTGYNAEETIGGGVCQGASTLYYCALLADFEIVAHDSQEFLASYIDPGMDATVNWPDTDLKFRNTTDNPVMIHAEYDNNHIKMRILGTNTRDYYVKMEYVMTEIEPEIAYEEHSSDSGYKNGQVLDEGQNGAAVTTYRCKYDKQTNALISRDQETKSSYSMVKKVVVRLTDTPTEPTKPAETTPVKPGYIPETPTTQPEPTEPTSAGTDPTAPSTEATTPSTEATTPSTEATSPSTESTEPTSGTSDPSTEPTSPGASETDPSTAPTESDAGSTDTGSGSSETGNGSGSSENEANNSNNESGSSGNTENPVPTPDPAPQPEPTPQPAPAPQPEPSAEG